MNRVRASLEAVDRRVVGTVCGGHFLSHFYLLVLPPLFPTLQREFGLSSLQLGVLAAAVVVGQLFFQLPLGSLVDRIGAKRVFVVGTALTGASISLAGLADSYALLLLFVGLSSVGQAAFHPADYPLLSEASTERTLGKVFSLHTFAGFAGYAAAPLTVSVLRVVYGWNEVLLLVGTVGVAYAVVAQVTMPPLYRRAVQSADAAGERADVGPARLASAGKNESLRRLVRSDVLLLFVFFGLTAMAGSGVRTFTTVFLVNDVGLTAVTSNSVLTVYVSAMTVGVLVGGVVSDRVSPYVVVPLVFALTAFSVFRVTRGGFVSVPLSVYGWFAVAGLFNGLALPSRDRLMNSFSTRASVGRSFGFAFTGVSLGALVSPVLLGFVFDTAGPSVGFGVVAALFVSAALVVLLAMFVRAGHVATPEPVEN